MVVVSAKIVINLLREINSLQMLRFDYKAVSCLRFGDISPGRNSYFSFQALKGSKSSPNALWKPFSQFADSEARDAGLNKKVSKSHGKSDKLN